MADADKTKEQLLSELSGLRESVFKLTHDLESVRRELAKAIVRADASAAAAPAAESRPDTAGNEAQGRDAHIQMAASVAGRIAHDFNNLLTPVIAYPALIRRSIPEDSPAREALDKLEQAGNNLVRITRRVLALSSRSGAEKKILNLSDIVEKVVSPLGASPTLAVQLQLPETPVAILGVEQQIVDAIRNVCQNAVEATDGAGELVIKLEQVTLDGGEVAPQVVSGHYAKMSITDSGTGIPEELRVKIFEPFFTTRQESKGRGAGLGLSITHAIVKEHGGYIDVDCPAAGGTCVSLYFPAGLPKSGAKAPFDTDAAAEGGTRILVVDDDEMIRSLFQMVLASSVQGAQVNTAANGAEAVASFRKHHHSLLVMDLNMPVMDGREAFAQISALCEEQKWPMPPVVFVSGFAPSDSVQSIVTDGGGEHVLLPKPVTDQQLVEQVRMRIAQVVPPAK
ncbi:MAG: response regulator [Kiritimatiellae bacterium]|nr:response regulator [Kiritimatiellia bacterium]